MTTPKLRPSESAEQRAVIQWALMNHGRYPELRLLFHIPNVRSSRWQRMNLALEGVKPGVPDLYLPSGHGGKFGLWIEMKANTGRLSHEQEIWLAELRSQNYAAEVCYGADDAIALLTGYLEQTPTRIT